MSGPNNAISALQEFTQSKNLPYPSYTEENYENGFRCTVIVAGVSAVGFGSTKKSAKHECAKNAMQKLKLCHLIPTATLVKIEHLPSLQSPQKNYVGMLNEFASGKGVKYPDYESLSVLRMGEFLYKCKFLDKQAIGRGSNKKNAKQDSARHMLDLVKDMDPLYIVHNFVIHKTEYNFKNEDDIVEMYKKLSVGHDTTSKTVISPKKTEIIDNFEIIFETDDNVSDLKAKLQSYGIKYKLQQLQHSPYIMHVQIDGTNLHFMGCGTTKEEATKEVLQDILKCHNSGVSVTTDDMISFT